MKISEFIKKNKLKIGAAVTATVLTTLLLVKYGINIKKDVEQKQLERELNEYIQMEIIETSKTIRDPKSDILLVSKLLGTSEKKEKVRKVKLNKQDYTKLRVDSRKLNVDLDRISKKEEIKKRVERENTKFYKKSGPARVKTQGDSPGTEKLLEFIKQNK